MVDRFPRYDAEKLLRECLESGEVISSKHFRDELRAEDLDFVDAWQVLRTGRVLAEPELDVRTRDWKYRVEGYEPGGKWLAIVFCFRRVDRTLLITVFSMERMRKP